MEGKEIFDGRDATWTCGEFPDTVVFAGQDLHVVICQEKKEKNWEGWWWCWAQDRDHFSPVEGHATYGPAGDEAPRETAQARS